MKKIKKMADCCYWLSSAIAVISDGIENDDLSTYYCKYTQDEGARMIEALEYVLSTEIAAIGEFLCNCELEEEIKTET